MQLGVSDCDILFFHKIFEKIRKSEIFIEITKLNEEPQKRDFDARSSKGQHSKGFCPYFHVCKLTSTPEVSRERGKQERHDAQGSIMNVPAVTRATQHQTTLAALNLLKVENKINIINFIGFTGPETW